MDKNNKQKSSPNHQVYHHFFPVSLNTLYNLIKDPNFISENIFQKSKIISIKETEESDYDKPGNEIECEVMGKFEIKLVVENVIEEETYRSFTHKCISVPPLFASFSLSYHFYYDSIKNGTVLFIEFNVLDSLYKHSLGTYLSSQNVKILKSLEELIKTKYTSINQSESISVKKNMDVIYNYFVNKPINLVHFFGYGELTSNITVNYLNETKELIVHDNIVKNVLILKVKIDTESNSDSMKNIFIDIVTSEKKIPKQNITIKFLQINFESSLIIFEHKITEYVDNTVLESYGKIKKNALWNLKNYMEKSGKF